MAARTPGIVESRMRLRRIGKAAPACLIGKTVPACRIGKAVPACRSDLTTPELRPC